jgi:hypothetical protein
MRYAREGAMMDPAFVIVMQCGIILCGMVLVAHRFAIPMLERQPLEDALCLLCLFHSFRYVVFGAFAPGNPLPIDDDPVSLAIDLTPSVLALITAGMLHVRMHGAIQAAWVFNLVGLAGLVVSLPEAVGAQAQGQPLGLAWHAFIYYAPALLVTHIMMLGWLYGYADRLDGLYRAAFSPAVPVARLS